jgi:cytochrome c peroxidase
MLRSLVWFLVLSAVLILNSCKEKQDPEGPFQLEFPSNFPSPIYSGTEKNPITKGGVALGRLLFYDTRLSEDNSISCGSCHQQFAAFSHLDHPRSHGIYGLFGTRNSPAVQNMAWNPDFMWDGGVNHLEIMPVAPITNPVEMNETMKNVVKKLNQDAGYRLRFKEVFGVDSIDDQKLLFAMAQFMTSMISADSKYDFAVRGERNVSLSKTELEGKQLFEAKCASCHAGALFTDHSFRNNGLSLTSDSGRAHITGLSSDRYKFRVPSLRNVELTRPYMHDGRFKTLKQVLDHYDNGVQTTQNLDPILTQNGYTGIELSEEEKEKLITFLKTLSDETFISNPKFSDPF